MLWGAPEGNLDAPSGAAAAFAIVAFMSFAMGVVVAVVLMLL